MAEKPSQGPIAEQTAGENSTREGDHDQASGRSRAGPDEARTAEADAARMEDRIAIKGDARVSLYFREGPSVARVLDVSRSGALLSFPVKRALNFVEGSPFSLQLGGHLRESVVMHVTVSDGLSRAGVAFTEPLEAPEDLAKQLESSTGPRARVELIVGLMSGAFARLVADAPDALDHLEWRDMERMLASVFEGIGFDVTLTPGAKDGGKDLILEFSSNGESFSYFVEVKHWRSGKRVSNEPVMAFLHLILREAKTGGLFLSTYGVAAPAIESLTSLQRSKVRFGQKEKVVSLCKTYLRAQSGTWSPPGDLTALLYDDTL